MNKLQSVIFQEIQRTGPITVKRFMELALYHPLYGYYKSQTVIGKKGDYITAPELTQAFGELLALWMIDLWQRLGAPPLVQIVELGPGKGGMMQDILRMACKFPLFFKRLSVYLLEVSPVLKSYQKNHLKDYPVYWVDNLSEVPGERITFFFANEFFDALPIQQHVKFENEWQARLIGEKGGRLHYLQTGEIKESCEDYSVYMKEINTRLLNNKGGALIIDYGDFIENDERMGDTLQALSCHRYADILKYPGEQDLTHHVNFRSLISFLDQKRLNLSLTEQGDFLQALGLELWIEKLCKGGDSGTIMNLKAAAARLISPQEMGKLFKVLAVESL